MRAQPSDFFASGSLRRLVADEARGLLPELQRCRGDHGLLLSAIRDDEPPALPLLSCWTRMAAASGRWGGDVSARMDEPLPFVDDAFELVWLRHALEAAALPQPLLVEAVRVLAPGGLLVLTGVHPMSLWTPWMVWQRRHGAPRLHMPLQLGEWLRRQDMRVDAVRRVGCPWPGRRGPLALSRTLGGGYALLAHKQRGMPAPVRLRPRPVHAPIEAGLASGARRNTA